MDNNNNKDRTSLNFLFEVDSPWISIGYREAESKNWIPYYFYNREGVQTCMRVLRGHKMRDFDSMLNEFAAALQFPEIFGENWDALNELLSYLDEWLPAYAYIIIIEKAEELLIDSPANHRDVETFFKIMNIVGEWWSNPIVDNGRFNRSAKPFHVLLNYSDDYKIKGKERLLKLIDSTGIKYRLHSARINRL